MKLQLTIIRICIMAVLAMVTNQNARALQNTRFFHDKELVSPNYSSFCRDADGKLWIGTQFGLWKFDGANFESYYHQSSDSTSLSDNRILKILRDNDNRIWVATAQGLNLYNPGNGTFTIIQPPGISFKGYIIDQCMLPNGDIVFEVSGVGLYIIDFTKQHPVAVRYMPGIYGEQNYTCLLTTPDGSIIAGTHTGEIVKIFPNGQTQSFPLTTSYVRFLQSDKTTGIYIGTSEGVWHWNLTSTQATKLDNPPGVKPTYHSATVTADTTLIIGTQGSGPYRVRHNSTHIERVADLYNCHFDLSKSRVSAIHVDESGNLWLGCSFQGIVLAPKTPLQFQYLGFDSQTPGTQGKRTFCVGDPRSARVYIADEDGMLRVIDFDGRISQLASLPGKVSSMMLGHDGLLYAGIDNLGLYQIDPATGTGKTIVNIGGSYEASAITEDIDGNFYLSIQGRGIIKADRTNGSYKWLRSDQNKPMFSWVTSLLCDRNNKIWIGMYGVFSTYDATTGEFKALEYTNPIFMDGVHGDLALAPDGRIYDATSFGLLVIDPRDESVRLLTAADGLADVAVTSVTVDNDGYAWAATRKGINRISPNLDEVAFFGTQGLLDSDFFSATLASHGRYVAFGGDKGVAFVRPRSISQPDFSSPVCITSVWLNDAKVTPATLTATGNRHVLASPVGPIKKINLSYVDNFLKMGLSTLDFREIGNVAYQWRIPQLNTHWQEEAHGVSEISLPHLRQGKYTLQIRRKENGELSPVTQVEISVSSPWYLSGWAKCIYVLIICGILAMLILAMRRRQRERINDERIRFFINISHEIRSPLTLILSPLEKLMSRRNDAETQRELSAIHRNATRILALINQLLDIRKMERGKMQLSCKETELVAYTNELIDMFQDQAHEKNITLTCDTPSKDKIHVWIDRNNFDKVLVNLITNALKYTPSGGEITVNVSQGINTTLGDFAQITVTDTGIGLDEKTKAHLFDRFYQGKFDRDKAPMGFGIGLDLCRLLVELHHGTIHGTNRQDGAKGSVFTVRVPLGMYHLTSAQTDLTSAQTESPALRDKLVSGSAIPTPASHVKRSRNTSLQILVADDNAELRRYLEENLSHMGRVYTAADGEEAMRIILDHRIDLVISDVVMPKIDGLTLLKSLKSNVATSATPVVLLSSKTDVTDRMEGWAKGADAYVGKPFSINELITIIDNLMDNRNRLRGKYSGTQEEGDRIETPEIKGNDKILMDKIIETIGKNLDNPDLNVEMLCGQVGLSRAHLNRKMKEIFGLSPSDYIRNMRLRRACQLLESPDIDISQIAYSVGFSSQPHFSTAFRRFTGVTPTEYRARKQGERT